MFKIKNFLFKTQNNKEIEEILKKKIILKRSLWSYKNKNVILDKSNNEIIRTKI